MTPSMHRCLRDRKQYRFADARCPEEVQNDLRDSRGSIDGPFAQVEARAELMPSVKKFSSSGSSAIPGRLPASRGEAG